jgi:N,N-dimethylformamidase
MRASRRQFLKVSAAGAAGLAAGQLPLAAASAASSPIPPHTPLKVEGIHGYASGHSVAAGSSLAFHISADAPFRFTVCRLGRQIDDPAGDELIHDAGELPAQVQPIHPGSYVHVEKRIQEPLKALTLECWVRPWSLERLAGLITQEDKQSDDGFALGFNKGGQVGFFLGNGVGPDDAVVHRSPPGMLTVGRWHHVVGRWDGQNKEIWVDGRRVAAWTFAGPLKLGTHPLRLGAMGDRGAALRVLDGDLAMAVIYDHALDDATIQRRVAERGLKPATGRGVLGCWTFAEERGDRIADRSRHRRHGLIINRGTWMIGGPSFKSDVPRFGDYDPHKDPERGHALRFAADDLYDCRWEPTLNWRVPREARPGIYVARLHHEREGKPRFYDITFIVRRAARAKRAPLLVLCSTNTWRAYNGSPFGVWPDSLHAVVGTDGLPNGPGNPPAFNLYRRHAAGQGTYQMGFRMPWPIASPYVLYGGPTRYSHLMRAERFLHAWLESEGYRFDVATDDDLHRDPGLLRGFRAVVLNGHSEYWSLPMLRGLDDYLRADGNTAIFSGNSLFWRVSFDDDVSVMECRKVDAPGDQMKPHERGEAWHSQDGRRGGMLRECGHPGWRYTGLETLGWNNQGNPKNFGPYVATQTDHFLFHQPEETGLMAGDRFGMAPDHDFTLANGHEMDIRLSTIAALQEQPNPPGGSVPPDPAGITQLANGIIPWKEGGAAFDYFFRPIKPKNDQGGEMIWWERPEGGRVFNAGCIAGGWAVHADPRLQTLVRNVLHRFGIPRRG